MHSLNGKYFPLKIGQGSSIIVCAESLEQIRYYRITLIQRILTFVQFSGKGRQSLH